MENKFLRIGWVEYLELVEKCLRKVEASPDFIFAPVRGGLIPAVIASHWLRKKMYAMEPEDLDKTIHPYSSEMIKTKRPPVLLLDDISDTGRTLHKCKIYLKRLGYEVVTCALAMQEGTCLVPDIFEIVVPKDKWVMFPYEDMDSEQKSIKEREE